MLDAAGRLASWTTEAQAEDGTWGAAATTTAHYGGTDDSPDWTSEPGGGISRNVEDLAGNLIATTSATGDVALTLTNLHGDVTTLIPLVDDTTPVVNVYDEYGTPQAGTDPARYGWLGGKQRSAETPSGVVLMGVRLYDPTIGRFLSVDPVYGGNANAYDYTFADPLNQYDLDGKWAWPKNQWNRARNKATRIGRNPNWRSVYHSGKFAIGAGALIHPVGRVRTVRGLWRAARSPKKDLQAMWRLGQQLLYLRGGGMGPSNREGRLQELEQQSEIPERVERFADARGASFGLPQVHRKEQLPVGRRPGGHMGKYKISPLVFFVPFMLASGFAHLRGGGWTILWGVCEVALGVLGIFVTVKGVRDIRRKREGESR
ncbi:RHS repeat-associated core domain-containing protein [Streptomyces anulatus]